MFLLQFRKYQYIHAAWDAVKKKSVNLQRQRSDCQPALPMSSHRTVVSVSDSVAYRDTASVRGNIINFSRSNLKLWKSNLKPYQHMFLWPLSVLEDIPWGAVRNWIIWETLPEMSSLCWEICSPKVLCKQLTRWIGNYVIFGSYYTRNSVLCTHDNMNSDIKRLGHA